MSRAKRMSGMKRIRAANGVAVPPLTDPREQRLDRVAGQLATVKSGGRQFAQRNGYFARCKRARLLERLAWQPCSEPGTTGHRGHAAPREETHFSEVASFHARSNLQNVSARRIRDFDARRSFGQFPRAARILKVIEDRFAEHIRSMPRARTRRNAAPRVRSHAPRGLGWPFALRGDRVETEKFTPLHRLLFQEVTCVTELQPF